LPSTFKLLERFKCESQNEDNGRKRSWGMSLTLNTFGVRRCVGAPRWGLRKVINKLIIHIDLHKPNNKLVNV
jgi:hypothetical protein